MKPNPLSILALIGLLFLACGHTAPLSFGAANKAYHGTEIILSWSGDTAHTQTISWRTPADTEGYVQYNRAGLQLSRAKQVKATKTRILKTEYYRCQATISGLSQNTKYDYRIGDGTCWSNPKQFTTAPMDTADTLQDSAHSRGDFSFLYLGDVQYRKNHREEDDQTWGRRVQQAKAQTPNIAFALTAGDMVNYADNLRDWSTFLRNAEPTFSQIPLMTTLGNHDYRNHRNIYSKLFSLPQNGPAQNKESIYSFDFAGCHIVVLDSTFFSKGTKKSLGAQWQTRLEEINRWLREDLRRAQGVRDEEDVDEAIRGKKKQAKWIVAAVHHPPYGMSQGNPIYKQLRRHWVPILEEAETDLVLCGHQHIYMRTGKINGITYIMGNSGTRENLSGKVKKPPPYCNALDTEAGNYQVVSGTDTTLSVTAYNKEGQVIDKWAKKKSGLWNRLTAAGKTVGFLLLFGLLLFLSLAVVTGNLRHPFPKPSKPDQTSW